MKYQFRTDDRTEATRWILADDAFSILSDLEQELRRLIKREELSEDAEAVVEKIRDRLHEELNDAGIELQKIWG
jgi:hypothetical protein